MTILARCGLVFGVRIRFGAAGSLWLRAGMAVWALHSGTKILRGFPRSKVAASDLSPDLLFRFLGNISRSRHALIQPDVRCRLGLLKRSRRVTQTRAALFFSGGRTSAVTQALHLSKGGDQELDRTGRRRGRPLHGWKGRCLRELPGRLEGRTATCDPPCWARSGRSGSRYLAGGSRSTDRLASPGFAFAWDHLREGCLDW